jgi:hypothetical protein
MSCRLKGGMGYWAPMLTLTFGTTWTAELSALGSGFALPHRKLLGTHFCQRLSGFQGYWMRALENSQTSYRESNTEPSVLWRSASTNCATRPPARYIRHPPPTPIPTKRKRNISNNTKQSPRLVKKYAHASTLMCAQPREITLLCAQTRESTLLCAQPRESTFLCAQLRESTLLVRNHVKVHYCVRNYVRVHYCVRNIQLLDPILNLLDQISFNVYFNIVLLSRLGTPKPFSFP